MCTSAYSITLKRSYLQSDRQTLPRDFCSASASANRSRTFFSVSPTNLLRTSGPFTTCGQKDNDSALDTIPLGRLYGCPPHKARTQTWILLVSKNHDSKQQQNHDIRAAKDLRVQHGNGHCTLGSRPFSNFPICRAIRVFPVPGGPKSKIPFTCGIPNLNISVRTCYSVLAIASTNTSIPQSHRYSTEEQAAEPIQGCCNQPRGHDHETKETLSGKACHQLTSKSHGAGKLWMQTLAEKCRQTPHPIHRSPTFEN